ncbi:MAG: histidine kinase [Candidatus Riflebacteria bacterium]|nr:histidine kinase [Candidatus Riflebacteria bacterium]
MRLIKPAPWKNLVLPIIIYLVGVIIFTFLHNRKTQQTILDDIDKRLLQAAQSIKYILPSDFHDRAIEKNSISEIEDINNIMAMTQYAKLVDVTYLSTALFSENDAFFTSHSTTDKDIADNAILFYGNNFPKSKLMKLKSEIKPQEPTFFFQESNSGMLRSVFLEEVSPSGNHYMAIAGIKMEIIDEILYGLIPSSIFQCVFFMLLAIPLIIVFTKTQIKNFVELENAKISAEKAQLEMLRYQLNPHFLFNTLNSINTLVLKNSNLASSMLLMLADFCRASLYRRGEELTFLENEIELMKNFLEIEKIRWGDSLKPIVECQPGLEKFKIPPFTFQPLVENAIKYGQLSESDPLKIIVSASTNNGKVILEVKNSGKWFEPDSPMVPVSTKVGLENLKKRLEKYFKNDYKMEISTVENMVSVKIILEYQ